MSDFELDRLRALGEGTPPGERTPELEALVGFASTMSDAETLIRAAAARRSQQGSQATAEQLEPDVFEGLAKFVRAVALGCEAVGVGLCSGEVLGLLKDWLLQPIIGKDAEGKLEARRPSAVCPNPSPTNVLQLLAAGVFLHVTGNPEPAIAMLSAALSGVWPPSKPMQRRLVARQFVPTAEVEGPRDEGASSTGEGDAAAAAADGADAGKAAGERAGPSSGSGSASKDACPSTSAAAAGQAPTAAQQADAEGEGDEQPTKEAAALAAALEQHCPGLSPVDVEKAALCLRLFLGCRAVGQQASDGPSFQAIIRTLLVDCQQLLDLDPGCMHAYVWATQLVLYARWPLDGRRVTALFAEGTRRSKEAKCWLAAGEVQHDWAMYRIRLAASQRNVAERQATLLEAGKLLEGVAEAEAALTPWMPAARLAQLSERRKQLGALLAQLQAGLLRPSGGAPMPRAGIAACAFCGKLAPAGQLRTCASCKRVSYCSRECQVKDWKQGGHKQQCTEAGAGQQAAAAAAGAGAAGSTTDAEADAADAVQA